MKKNNDDFIMLPTVDFCFKELMNNPKIRSGFCAAIMGFAPEEIEDTKLMPTELPRSTAEEKFGILDVLLMMADGTRINMEMQVKYFVYWNERVLFYLSKIFSNQIRTGEEYGQLRKCIHVSILDFNLFHDDVCYRKVHFRDDSFGELYSDKMEIQILELKKLPKNVESGEDIIRWMRFFGGRNKEELAKMAKGNEYLEEAYRTLVTLSADEKKRLEYEAREKAIRDHNWMMECMRKEGLEAGRKEGLATGRKEGLATGRKEGLATGRKEGKKEGKKEGQECFARLILRLTEDGRSELIAESASDPALRQRLFEEYGIL